MKRAAPKLFRGLPVTARQLRNDRIIEEAVSGRSDPLHLGAVFGFGARTGLRYAQAARDTADAGSPAACSARCRGCGWRTRSWMAWSASG